MLQKVLILCTGNSCRSQMAEGILRHYGGDKFEVYSAGSDPVSQVNPIAIQVMNEIGIDISENKPKHLKDFLLKKIHVVITVCDNAKESCPLFPSAPKQLHWSFPDPPHGTEVSAQVVEEFREVRDMILEKFKPVALTGKID